MENLTPFFRFSYTKLDNNGNILANNATDWACVKDNVSGLIWEKKQTSGLHSHPPEYHYLGSAKNFAEQVNTATLCGLSNWRLPNRIELLGLTQIQRATFDRSVVTIDETYFPNTGRYHYMTSLTFDNFGNSDSSVVVNFTRGEDIVYPDSGRHGYVRLVSDGGIQNVVL